MITPHKTPNKNTKAPCVSPETGHVRSTPWQIQAGHGLDSAQCRLGVQVSAGHKGQLGVAQIAKAVETPLVSSGTMSGSR